MEFITNICEDIALKNLNQARIDLSHSITEEQVQKKKEIIEMYENILFGN